MKPIDQLSEAEWMDLVRRAAGMSDAPAAWVRSALELWHVKGSQQVDPARPALPVPPPGPAPTAPPPALRRWFAALSFDSWAAPALASGMRMVGSDVRHLLFSAEGRDVDLRIAPEGEAYAVRGQLLGPNGDGQVVLTILAPGAAGDAAAGGAQGALSHPAEAHVAALDELGEFRLDGVTEGAYLLTVRLREDEIVLAPIAIGPPPGVGA